MFPHPLHQQFLPSFHTFASHENMFSATANIFSTSLMTPPSTYRPLLPSHCYHPSLPSQGFGNPPLDQNQPEPTDYSPNNQTCASMNHKGGEINHHLTPLPINSPFSFM